MGEERRRGAIALVQPRVLHGPRREQTMRHPSRPKTNRNFTKNGQFSVRSAYHLAIQRKKAASAVGESSRSSEDHKFWLALWGAEVPNKIKVHVWRLIENGLAVGKELKQRKIKDGVVCLVCGREESLLHRFWSCPHSIAAWASLRELSGARLESPPQCISSHGDLKRWLLEWIGRNESDQVAWYMQLLCNLWLARNDARESQKIEDPVAVARRSLAAVEEWLNLKDNPPMPIIRPVERWLVPESGWYKVNADAAFRSDGCTGGGGAFVAGESRFFPHVVDAEGAELLACRRAALLAKEMQVSRLVLETDNKNAAVKLLKEDQDRSVHRPLIHEIKSILRSFDDVKVLAIRRTANEVLML